MNYQYLPDDITAASVVSDRYPMDVPPIIGHLNFVLAIVNSSQQWQTPKCTNTKMCNIPIAGWSIIIAINCLTTVNKLLSTYISHLFKHDICHNYKQLSIFSCESKPDN